MNTNKYVRTDLAAESPIIEGSKKLSGIKVDKTEKNGCRLLTVNVLSDEGEKLIGKPRGSYVTLDFGNVLYLSDENLDDISSIISDIVKSMAKPFYKNGKVLIAGLGNRYITADAVGPLTVKNVTVTRHLKNGDEKSENIFNMLKMQDISAISPGVVGQTGIETYDMIKSASNTVKPDLIVVIDALAAKSTDRLATTVQICNAGIAPGSGIGNKRKAINESTMGVPVIAVGIPTMVSSSTLVCDALEKAGINDLSPSLISVLENGQSFFVTLNESDVVVSTLASVVADGINQAFSL